MTKKKTTRKINVFLIELAGIEDKVERANVY